MTSRKLSEPVAEVQTTEDQVYAQTKQLFSAYCQEASFASLLCCGHCFGGSDLCVLGGF